MQEFLTYIKQEIKRKIKLDPQEEKIIDMKIIPLLKKDNNLNTDEKKCYYIKIYTALYFIGMLFSIVLYCTSDLHVIATSMALSISGFASFFLIFDYLYKNESNNLQSCGWPLFINMLWDIIRTPNKVDV